MAEAILPASRSNEVLCLSESSLAVDICNEPYRAVRLFSSSAAPKPSMQALQYTWKGEGSWLRRPRQGIPKSARQRARRVSVVR